MASPAENEKVVREAHAKSMEALAADVHPYSASAIRDWEKQLDDALAALCAQAEAGAEECRRLNGYIDQYILDVERLEARLARIIEYRPCLRFDITPCDQRAEFEEVEWCPLCVARAALSGEPS